MARLTTRGKVGARVKALREERGLTQTTFAQLIGISRPYLARIETGESNVTIDSLTKIAAGLDTPLAAFFDNEMFRTIDHKTDGVVTIPAQRTRTDASRAILELIKRDPHATTNVIAYTTGLSSATVGRTLAHLKAAGRVVRVGSPRTGHWEVVDGNVDAAGGARA